MQARKKKQKIVVQVDKSVPNCIETDPNRLQQIIHNLLNNAIKFSDDNTRIDIESYYLHDAKLF
jgi:signal transduction histidine kinase